MIRVLYSATGSEFAEFYKLTKDGEPFGKIRIQRNDPLDMNHMSEESWLFEKIKRLPRAFCIDKSREEKIEELKNPSSVTIEGNDEAAKLFKLRN